MATSAAWVMVTVNWPPLEGSAALGSLAAMLTVAASLSVMFTVALTVALRVTCGSPEVMVPSVTITVSVASSTRSSITVTSMVAVVLNAAIVNVPDNAV